MTDRALIDHISSLPHSRANFKQLVREVGAKGPGREGLEAALARLTARGELIELRSGHYVVTARSREFAIGRLNMHRDGYGFLISEKPLEGIQGDVFIPPESAGKAMHGDRVLVRIVRVEADGRADGEIVKVLKRAHPTVVGEFRRTTGFSSGSRSPRASNFRPRALPWIASASLPRRPPRSKSSTA